MRHRVAGRKLDRPTNQRIALYRSLVTDLLRHDKIVTTEAKAKEIRGMVERVITMGKTGTLHARRCALSRVGDRDVVSRVFKELKERYSTRPGGYTRVTKLGPRYGDAAPMAQIELV